MKKQSLFLLLHILFISSVYANTDKIVIFSTPLESNITTLTEARKFNNWELTNLPFYELNSNTHFIKFDLNKSSKKRILVVENPVLDTLFIFIYRQINNDSLKLLRSYKNGKTFPFAKDKYSKNVLPNFEIPKTNDDLRVFIKTQSTSQTSVPITVSKINEFVETVGNTNSIAGVYFGILIVMLLYNMFIWSSVKEKTYLYYCFYILALIFTQLVLQGYAKKYLGPNSAAFNLHAIVFSGSTLGIATIIFARSFLKSKKYLPKLDLGLKLIIPLCFLSLVMDLTNHFSLAFNVINIVIGLGSLYLFAVSIIVYRKGYKPSLFFIIAFAIFLIGTLVFVAKDYGQIPYNNISIYGYQFGSVIQVILLSLALANSINILKKEKEKEQSQKLEALEENKRIILNQN